MTARAVTGRFRRLIDRLDAGQRRRRWAAFPVAVAKKWGEDRAGSLAALIAYYGFFSLFPLLLVFVTILGFVIRDDPALQQRIIDSAIGQFPVVGSDIAHNVRALQGSVPLLLFGLATALWSGMAVVSALQHALDEVWDVPRRTRDPFLRRLPCRLGFLLVLGVGIPVAATLSGIGTSGAAPIVGRLLALVGAAAIDVALFGVAFRFLTAARPSWTTIAPGAILAGLAWLGLEVFGTYLVDQRIRGASDVYGFFAVVFGLLWWLYLGAQVTLVAAEINVVRARGLWPRRIAPPPTGPGDRKGLALQAAQTESVPGERVEVRFDEDDRVQPRGTDRDR